VYVNWNMERKLEDLAEWKEGKEEKVIGGILMRERREERRIKEKNEGEKKEKRKSMDRKENKNESKLIEFIREKG